LSFLFWLLAKPPSMVFMAHRSALLRETPAVYVEAHLRDHPVWIYSMRLEGAWDSLCISALLRTCRSIYSNRE
jgi:hypothetical protein